MAVVQTLLQKPQSFTEFVSGVSQSDWSLSQSPSPCGQVETWHMRFAQTWNEGSQVTPQPPQFDGSLAICVSQPFAGSPSQSAKSAAHTGTQLPATQLVVPFAFVHGAPQLPQSSSEVVRSVSQPFWTTASQSPDVLGTQLGSHSPSKQVVDPDGVVQTRSQPPQLITSFVVDVSQPLSVRPSQAATILSWKG